MKTRMFGIAALGLSLLSTGALAQPVVTYTTSGTSGNYTLDFTINNLTPGTQGFDIYFFGVLVDGMAFSSPPGYNSSYYSPAETVEISGPALNWPFNNTWIDPSYSELPMGTILSGFDVSDTDQSAPTSVQYFAFGTDAGANYGGPDNVNAGNPSNPLFIGNATEAVPEPATISMLMGISLLALGRAAFQNGRLRRGTISSSPKSGR